MSWGPDYWDEADKVIGVPDPDALAAARALRNAPPETDPGGAATEAEMTRMRTGPEPGTWRDHGTWEDDEWYIVDRQLPCCPHRYRKSEGPKA